MMVAVMAMAMAMVAMMAMVAAMLSVNAPLRETVHEVSVLEHYHRRRSVSV